MSYANEAVDRKMVSEVEDDAEGLVVDMMSGIRAMKADGREKKIRSRREG